MPLRGLAPCLKLQSELYLVISVSRHPECKRKLVKRRHGEMLYLKFRSPCPLYPFSNASRPILVLMNSSMVAERSWKAFFTPVGWIKFKLCIHCKLICMSIVCMLRRMFNLTGRSSGLTGRYSHLGSRNNS